MLDSKYLFAAILPPPLTTVDHGRIIALAREAADQALPAVGAAISRPGAKMSVTCLDIPITNCAKCGLSLSSQRPKMRAQFSSVTSIPASWQASTALLAYVAAATASTKRIISSSAMVFSRFAMRVMRESLKRGKRP